MPTDAEVRFELYKLYLETAEKVSDRRAAANGWMLSVNSAIVAFYGYLGHGKATVQATEDAVWSWAIPAAGILVCLAWSALLASYRKLNGAKFKVLHELEKELPFRIFTREREFYQQERRRRLSGLELAVPWSFTALYAILLLATVLGVAFQ